MKYYKKLSPEKLENQNENKILNDHIKLIICDRSDNIMKKENQKPQRNNYYNWYRRTNTASSCNSKSNSSSAKVNKKFITTFITLTKNYDSDSCDNDKQNYYFTKCKISGRDNCFWCIRSSTAIEMKNRSISDCEIVDPEDFFQEIENKEKQENESNDVANETQTKIRSDCGFENERENSNNVNEQDPLENDLADLHFDDWEIIELPIDLNQNFFSSGFENEIVAAMSSSFMTASQSENYCCDTNANNNTAADNYCCQLSGITFCELICCRLKIINGIPEKSSPKTVFDTVSSSSSTSSSLSPLSSLPKLSSCKIKTTISTRKVIRSQTEEKAYRKSSKVDAYARSIMGAIGKCQDCDSNNDTSGSNSSSDIDENQNLDNNNFMKHRNRHDCDPFDIQEYFKLDDNENILIDISHIIEEKGHGFLMRRTKNIYRNVKCGVAINESYTVKKCLIERIHYLLKIIKGILFGHPRNKTQIGGPGESVRAYTLHLANDHTSTFSRNIENFISCTKESREAAPQVVMRNMRQFMNGMKNYLVKHGEGDFHQEVQKARSRLKADEFLNLDAILEGVMHQLVVLPLREHLYGMFVDYYTRSGDIQLLVENVKYACGRSPSDFGIRATVAPPTSMQLNQISSLLVRLQEAELPLDKLDLFLCIIAAVFEATGCPRGQQLGADDFLPILVFVVAKCGFVGAEIEAEFMWGLLQPALLSGEAGYYLTALCSAVHVLKSFMSSDNEGTGSLDWRSSSLPACSSVLRVIIPDECNGSLQTRTLPVRPHTTTREVCRIIAHKARITNPQDYGLFKLVDGEETILADSECPQDARIAARGKHCMLAYKRIDAKIAWPTATTQQPSYA